MARDLYHNAVREALEKDGWSITHDPLHLPKKIIGAKLEIDLGANKIIIAEKTTEKIAVEVKSFIKPSVIHEFHAVLGQYLGYIVGLEKQEAIITDTKRHHYFLQWIGFDAQDRFINKPLLHFHIKPNGKIWLLANLTETDVAEELILKGVDKKDIVLGFLAPLIRVHSGFAVA